jgi:hypothetical protein
MKSDKHLPGFSVEIMEHSPRKWRRQPGFLCGYNRNA